MGKKVDLTGQMYGRLTVLEDVGRDKHHRVIWRCLCECGNIVDTTSDCLQKGDTKSCGCYNREKISERFYKDLTGQIFGRLTVLGDAGRRRGNVLWRCQCSCGNIVVVVSYHLQNGHTQSCGCYYKEQYSGENNNNWKGGITPLSNVIRHCSKYLNWRTSVFQRDDFTCQHCNQVGRKLRAHHIKRFSVILEEFNITTLEEAQTCVELWDTNNGITLCKKCHKKEHSKSKAKL